jgi:hypothetical protein
MTIVSLLPPTRGFIQMQGYVCIYGVWDISGCLHMLGRQTVSISAQAETQQEIHIRESGLGLT